MITTPRSAARRRRRTLGLAAAGLATLGSLAAAHTAAARGAGAIPRFTLEITQYQAVDETGVDWIGADEVYIAASIDAMVDLWEKEGGQSLFDSNGPQPSPGRTNLSSQDELIGSTRVRYSSAELRTILDERGEAFGWNEDLRINGHYRVTFVIARVT